ncbi:MAG: bifunctional DNA-formamidopyrimidine glycosylase/DNA-(apurinic or apyrimidinic site) lyase [Arcanobacterium sp.]|nr:bifunctional DNA-formamidopyrimidine glycosylase/DNA-(apurinic or apyrimidinic site) lyase [Arcanobacterium sp.]
MPELPEVETIRRGLEPYVLGKTILQIETFHPRVDRYSPGLLEKLSGKEVQAVVRRGKYLWFEFADAALVAHLRMSGQFRIGGEVQKHCRARITFTNGEALDFVDQRTFGFLQFDNLIPTVDCFPAGQGSARAEIPKTVAHIARDLIDPNISITNLAQAAKERKTRIKTLLLDQGFVSGIGNIYADEALWAAQVNGARAANTISSSKLVELLEAAKEVMQRAIAVGGTSFDELYVNVDGSSGYFARSLNAYGRSGNPCGRCGTILVREAFMGRSSTFCPKCQARRR